jgi:nitrous oxidase accessory protein NosD
MDIDSGIHVIARGSVEIRAVRWRTCSTASTRSARTRSRSRHCTLTGRVRPLDESGEGNGLHLWYCSNVTVRDNDVSRFVDAVYLSFVTPWTPLRNRLHDNGRYGLHTMYCQQNRFVENE